MPDAMSMHCRQRHVGRIPLRQAVEGDRHARRQGYPPRVKFDLAPIHLRLRQHRQQLRIGSMQHAIAVQLIHLAGRLVNAHQAIDPLRRRQRVADRRARHLFVGMHQSDLDGGAKGQRDTCMHGCMTRPGAATCGDGAQRGGQKTAAFHGATPVSRRMGMVRARLSYSRRGAQRCSLSCITTQSMSRLTGTPEKSGIGARSFDSNT